MKKTAISTAAIAAMSVILYWYFAREVAPPHGELQQHKLGTVNADSTTESIRTTSNAGLLSPFGRGAAPTARSLEQRVKERRARMEKLKYSTPPEYFRMSLRELKIKSEKKDVFALLQLGEQYWSEADDIVNDPSYDGSQPSKQLATNYMIEAARQGHSQVSNTVTTMYEERGEEVQAYAWSLVSQLMLDKSYAERSTAYAAHLSKAQRDEAEDIAFKEYAEIRKVLNARFLNANATPASASQRN